jgi:DNA-binding response OmpR family regulator/HEAT repeat protein/predicted Ser/Thr protein kinase
LLDKLGEFKLLDLLGEGGMGTVYRAMQESLGREVAVKILPESLTRDPQFVQRFYREARSAAGLIHPNVVQIYSLGHDEGAGLHYYAMEYVRGEDLSHVLHEGKRFSLSESVNIVLQIAEALAAAAEGNIVHRDIKPANIMLTGSGQVKVMDFGLAKIAGDETDVTGVGTVVGTANYMSPEQGLGKDLDGRTDIYSLGVVFFELLTGQVPFSADDPTAVIFQHIYEEPPKPSSVNSGIPPAVDRLVLHMLAKAPEDRPAAPAEVIGELRSIRRALESGETGGAAVLEEAGEPEQAAKAPEEAAQPGARAPVAQRARAGTVLICEGSDYIGRMYRTCLKSDYAVAVVARGRECIEMAREGRPDVVIIDMAIRDPGAFTVLDSLREESPGSAILVITSTPRSSTIKKLGRYGLAGVMVKPVKLPDLQAKVAQILSPVKSAAVERSSRGFVARAKMQETAVGHQLNVAGLANNLLGRSDRKDAKSLARRVRTGSPNRIVGIIRDVFKGLSPDEAWQVAIFAFKKGDYRVRILACELARRRFTPPKAAQLLTRFAADTDYRVRTAALRELSVSGAPEAEEFLARFLGDESVKVSREACRGLEKLSGGERVVGALISHYARKEMGPPLYLQRLVKTKGADAAVAALGEVAAKSRSTRAREFVAGLLSMAASRSAVPVLVGLLEDERSAVRTAAARALASFPGGDVKEALFARLTDDRFGVLKAVTDTLGVFELQETTRALIKLFTTTGKRVPAAAAEFIARCDPAPDAFEKVLLDIGSQSPGARQVLGFVLKRLYESDEAVTGVVRRLRGSSEEVAAGAAREVCDRLAKFLAA